MTLGKRWLMFESSFMKYKERTVLITETGKCFTENIR